MSSGFCQWVYCLISGKNFKAWLRLKLKLSWHDEVLPFSPDKKFGITYINCDSCGKAFWYVSKFQWHLGSHKWEAKFLQNVGIISWDFSTECSFNNLYRWEAVFLQNMWNTLQISQWLFVLHVNSNDTLEKAPMPPRLKLLWNRVYLLNKIHFCSSNISLIHCLQFLTEVRSLWRRSGPRWAGGMRSGDDRCLSLKHLSWNLTSRWSTVATPASTCDRE